MIFWIFLMMQKAISVKGNDRASPWQSRSVFRSCTDAAALIGEFSAWTGLRSIVMMEPLRAAKRRYATLEYRYYISSQALIAEKAGQAIQAHWGIESMHWILDVSLQEDTGQIYRENAAENLAGLRHMALNMMREEETKISIPMKQKRSMINPAFLEQVLLARFASVAN